MKVFSKWLKLQVDRIDSIGDLARDFVSDKQKPYITTARQLHDYITSMEVLACIGARKALVMAYREYLKSQRHIESPVISNVFEPPKLVTPNLDFLR